MSYTILPATPAHLPFLPAIEDAAARLFPTEGMPGPWRTMCQSPEDFATAFSNDLLWVVVAESGAPVGFLLAGELDGGMHILEFDVHPDHGKRGVGAKLLDHVLAIAKLRSFPAVTLTTFEHFPWNAPFYAKHGFQVIDTTELSAAMLRIAAKEKELGMSRRVAMKRWL